MSAPVREPDDGPSSNQPSNDAPKNAERPDPNPTPLGPRRERDAALRNPAPETERAPWRRAKRQGPFAGDVAVVELRNRLTLSPHPLPEPPAPSGADAKPRSLRRLAGLAVIVVVAFVGYRLGSAPPASPPQPGLDSSPPGGQRATSESPSRTANPLLPPDPAPAAMTAIVRPSGRLAIGAAQPQPADNVASLTVSAADAGAGAAVVISGLASGMTLSTGTQIGPNRWRLSLEDLAGAAVTPPRGFIGAVDLTLELRLADNTVADRKNLQLEWSANDALTPAKPAQRRLDAGQIAAMVKSGAEYMASGSVGAARLMLQPAAEAGDAVAAFALAETYDPLVLRKLNAIGGISPDVRLAQAWYQKARDLGSAEAPERLARLARLP